MDHKIDKADFQSLRTMLGIPDPHPAQPPGLPEHVGANAPEPIIERKLNRHERRKQQAMQRAEMKEATRRLKDLTRQAKQLSSKTAHALGEASPTTVLTEQ